MKVVIPARISVAGVLPLSFRRKYCSSLFISNARKGCYFEFGNKKMLSAEIF
jgi:hypothetical protein